MRKRPLPVVDCEWFADHYEAACWLASELARERYDLAQDVLDWAEFRAFDYWLHCPSGAVASIRARDRGYLAAVTRPPAWLLKAIAPSSKTQP